MNTTHTTGHVNEMVKIEIDVQIPQGYEYLEKNNEKFLKKMRKDE